MFKIFLGKVKLTLLVVSCQRTLLITDNLYAFFGRTVNVCECWRSNGIFSVIT